MTQCQSSSPFEWKVDDGTSSIKVIEGIRRAWRMHNVIISTHGVQQSTKEAM